MELGSQWQSLQTTVACAFETFTCGDVLQASAGRKHKTNQTAGDHTFPLGKLLGQVTHGKAQGGVGKLAGVNINFNSATGGFLQIRNVHVSLGCD